MRVSDAQGQVQRARRLCFGPHVAVFPVALRPFPVADHHVQVSLAAGNDTRRRRRHLETRAPQSQGLNSGSPRLAEERGGEVDVEVGAANVGVEFRRQ